MANKNTIQTIPLNGALNMNTLKTDVRQFEGFNEKNSTVFGGTLSPLYEKTSELYSSEDSYTVFNNKGDAFSLVSDKENNTIFLKKNGELIDLVSGTFVTDTVQLKVPDNTVVAVNGLDDKVIAVTKDGKVWKDKEELTSFDINNLTEAQIWYTKDRVFLAATTNTECQLVILTDNSSVKSGLIQNQKSITSTMSPLFIGGYDSDKVFHVYVQPDSGKNIGSYPAIHFSVDADNNITDGVEPYYKYIESFDRPGFLDIRVLNTAPYVNTKVPHAIEYEQFAFRDVRGLKLPGVDTHEYQYTDSYSSLLNPVTKVAKSNLDEKLPRCPMGPHSSVGSVYYLNGTLISVGRKEQPIDSTLYFGRKMISMYESEGSTYINYQKSDGNWFCYKEMMVGSIKTPTQKYLKRLIFDEKYIMFKGFNGMAVYDTSTESIVSNAHDLDWIISVPPYVNDKDLTGVDKKEIVTSTANYSISVTYVKVGIINSIVYQLEVVNQPVDNNYTHWYKLHIGDSDVMAVVEKGRTTGRGRAHKGFTTGLTLASVSFSFTGISNTDTFGTVKGEISIRPNNTVFRTGSITYTTSFVPSTGSNVNSTGIMYGAGVNAGYAVNNANFIGFIPNAFVESNFPADVKISYPEVPSSVQYYCSRGSSVRSATYVGTDSQFFDTTYAIDTNNNIILPISMNAKILPGYSNNDLVREDDVTYPLIYYNGNQKIYAYFLLAAVENMTNVFSLQGQSYTVDDNNIYAATFESGIIQSLSPVCYKKNMTFLGALPGQAVFYSSFNKTFYAFTGDRVLNKLFEASYIDEILYVGQNPASLSLWICTDKGIYIMSDTDMYKLDYVSSYVSFQEKNVIIITDEDNIQKIHVISLYKNDETSKKIPVKLQTCFYGIGNEQKAVLDCWYIRLYEPERIEGDIKVKVNTITDVTRHSEEKTFHISPSDYDENNIVYLRYQPKYQDCVGMQLELESPIGIYELALGVNATDSTPQISKMNF